VKLASGGLTIAKESFLWDRNTIMGQLGLMDAPHRKAVKEPMEPEPRVVIASENPTESDNATNYQTFVGAFNRHDPVSVGKYMADDFIGRDAPVPGENSRQDTIEDYAEMFRNFPDMQWTLRESWGAGDYVFGNASMTASSGTRKVDLASMEFLRFEDGKATRSWLFYDGRALAIQLGVIDSSGDKAAAAGTK
jgi:predicted SnoaL-like aldol condensation-catalyzing enzyme